jgi:hypothetical protein
MNRLIMLVMVALLYLGGNSQAGEDHDLSFTTALLRSTFKIYGPAKEGFRLGTVFVMGKPHPTAKDKSYYVLITAAHVLEQIQGDKAVLVLRVKEGEQYSRLEHTINIRDGDKPLWAKHSQVDVAAMLIPMPEKADVVIIPTHFLATDNRLTELEITAGDQLLVLGYPYGNEANTAGFPILRSGRIASYPLIPSSNTKSFLLDFPVFKGNRGGPVFFHERIRRFRDGTTKTGEFVTVLGLVSQEREIKEEVRTLSENTVRSHKLGIAAVVHASFIRDLVESLAIPSIPRK